MMITITYQALLLSNHSTQDHTPPTRVGSFWPRFVNRLRKRLPALKSWVLNRVTGVTGNRGIA